MRTYILKHTCEEDLNESLPPQYWSCQADDMEHAIGQLKDADPDAVRIEPLPLQVKQGSEWSYDKDNNPVITGSYYYIGFTAYDGVRVVEDRVFRDKKKAFERLKEIAGFMVLEDNSTTHYEDLK